MVDEPNEHQAGRSADDQLALFRLVAESSRDLILIGRVDDNEWISPSVEEILGYTPEEFLSYTGSALVHPDDRAAVEGAKPFIAAGKELGGRVRVRHRDGSYRWLDTRVRPLAERTAASVGGRCPRGATSPARSRPSRSCARASSGTASSSTMSPTA